MKLEAKDFLHTISIFLVNFEVYIKQYLIIDIQRKSSEHAYIK